MIEFKDGDKDKVERIYYYSAFLQCPFSSLSTVHFQDSDEDNGKSGENMRRVERSSPLWVSTLYGFDCQHSGSGNLVLPAYILEKWPKVQHTALKADYWVMLNHTARN